MRLASRSVAAKDEEILDIDGREVRITSPGKVYFPERGETKLDLVNHYVRVREPLMRTMGGRPLLLERYPEGAGGPSFYQKRIPDSAPKWLETTIVSTPNGTESRALVAADVAHIAWAVNMGVLGFHVWPYLADDPAHTDELRLDLDPQPGTDFTHIREAARELRALLDELGVVGYPKTTGNRGLHVYVRLEPRWDSYRGAFRCGGDRARARAAPARRHHGAVVEGGPRGARVHRLQPERAAQDGVRRVVRAGAARRAGLDPARVGRDRRDPSGRADDRLAARPARGSR